MSKIEKTPISKKQLAQILSKATSSVEELLKSEHEALNKADPGEEATGEGSPEGSSVAPPADASSAPAPEAVPGGPPADAAPGDDGSPEETPEYLKSQYDQLPIESKKMHFIALKASIESDPAMAAGDPGADTSTAPQPDAAAPVSPEQSAPPMGKKEFSVDADANGGAVSGGKMAKSELNVSSVILERLEKAEKALLDMEDMKKALAAKDQELATVLESAGKAAAGMNRLLERQQVMRKSLTTIAVSMKPGESNEPDFSNMAKSEIVEKLKTVTSDPSRTLSKSDREAINEYVINRNVAPTKIAKFLK